MTKKFDPKELENSKRIYKSATPKEDLSWYVKWFASACILTAVLARSAGRRLSSNRCMV